MKTNARARPANCERARASFDGLIAARLDPARAGADGGIAGLTVFDRVARRTGRRREGAVLRFRLGASGGRYGPARGA